jgi:hypothetical protein
MKYFVKFQHNTNIMNRESYSMFHLDYTSCKCFARSFCGSVTEGEWLCHISMKITSPYFTCAVTIIEFQSSDSA